jgi:FKBP-type peptidyl-prolyl cis-trans isomerase FkpA
MKQLKNVLGMMCCVALLAACNNIEFKKTRGGIPYKIFPGKGGKKIVQNDFVKFHVIQKIGDSVRFSTYTQAPQYLQVTVPVMGYDIKENLLEVLTKAKTGDSLYFVQVVDSFIAKNPEILKMDTTLKKGQQIITTVRIVDVFKTQEQVQADMQKENSGMMARMEQEQMNRMKNDPAIQQQLARDTKMIEDYLAKNNIKAQKVGLGTYVEIQRPGSGPNAAKGKFVSVFYRGTTMDGKEFDSNIGKDPATFQLQNGQLIMGFVEGLTQMNKGAKGRIFMPSSLAYGKQAPPAIGPDANLIFEIEMLDIMDTPPSPKMPPQQQGHPDTGSHEGHNH